VIFGYAIADQVYYLLHISNDCLFSLRRIPLVQAVVIAISVAWMASSMPPVVLFGYDCEVNCSYLSSTRTDTPWPASPFTQKVRLVLKLKQIPYSEHPLLPPLL
jgi:Glutathione S-transferase, N-terminal domain